MKYLLFLFFLANTPVVFAQSNLTVDSAALQPEDPPFTFVEQMPEYSGDPLAFVRQHIVYPESALHERVEGKVYVQFVVEADGTLTNAKVLRGLSADCDKEALRVISEMPRWKPGKQNGRPVRVYFNLPVNFRIEE